MSDFGEGKWVIGRNRHRCEYCHGPIPKAEEHYRYKGIYDGEWQNWRMHRECEDDFHREGDFEFMPGEAPIPDRVKLIVS